MNQLKVLLIYEDDYTSFLYYGALSRSGFEVYLCKDLTKLLPIIDSVSPDLILWHPVNETRMMVGKCVSDIARNYVGKKRPKIMLSASAFIKGIQFSVPKQVDKFFYGPVPTSELRDMIIELFTE